MDNTDANEDSVILAGHPYITKINGSLVMVKSKKDKFIRRRSQSLDVRGPPLLSTAPTYSPQQAPQLTPLFHHSFSGVVPVVQLQPVRLLPVAPPYPTQSDLEQLKLIRTDYRLRSQAEAPRICVTPSQNEGHSEEKQPADGTANETTKTTVTMTLHICANCQRLRSRKYQHQHPIKPGEIPAPAFCRRCQKDDSSTESSRSETREPRKKRKNYRKKIEARDRRSIDRSRRQNSVDEVIKGKRRASSRERDIRYRSKSGDRSEIRSFVSENSGGSHRTRKSRRCRKDDGSTTTYAESYRSLRRSGVDECESPNLQHTAPSHHHVQPALHRLCGNQARDSDRGRPYSRVHESNEHADTKPSVEGGVESRLCLPRQESFEIQKSYQPRQSAQRRRGERRRVIVGEISEVEPNHTCYKQGSPQAPSFPSSPESSEESWSHRAYSGYSEESMDEQDFSDYRERQRYTMSTAMIPRCQSPLISEVASEMEKALIISPGKQHLSGEGENVGQSESTQLIPRPELDRLRAGIYTHSSELSSETYNKQGGIHGYGSRRHRNKSSKGKARRNVHVSYDGYGHDQHEFDDEREISGGEDINGEEVYW
ncbi:hypothetical protein F5884DRAFT_849639 [Xylogone sp. PMI_703]|nr:hypothetical protein F5884DRAFT_849639 [Xylogone sp. PMI_703]